MSEQLMKTVYDCATGETTVEPFTPEEIAEHEAMVAQAAKEQAQREAEEQALADLKASAKAKLIAGEPLTADEADTLVI